MISPTASKKKKIFFLILILSFLFSACASPRKHESLQFHPTLDKNFSSRGKPAQISSAPESELVEKGHVKLGQLVVDLNETECFKRRLPKKDKPFKMCKKVKQKIDSTTRLLKEASKRGADLVSLSKDNVIIKNKSINKKGECIRHQTKCSHATVPVYQVDCYNGVCNTRQTGTRTQSLCNRVCTAHRKIHGEAAVLRSEGILWRLDPVMATEVRLKSVFTKAIIDGDIPKIKALIAEGADVSWKNSVGTPMIILAAISKQPEALKVLLENKAKLNAVDAQHKYTALQYSVLLDQLKITKMLIEGGADPNFIEKNGDGDGVLHTAVIVNKKEFVEYLIKKGAQVNIKGGHGNTPLHEAISFDHFEMAKLLISLKADINAGGKRGTPLTIAATKGDKKMVTMLIAKGANSQGKDLHGAIRYGHIDIAEILLSKGANIEARNWGNWTPLQTAASVGNVKAFKFLMKKGADIKVKDGGMNLLHIAAAGNLVGSSKDHGEMVEMLIKLGFDVHESSGWSLTPLHWAARSGTKGAGEALLEKGAKIDASGIRSRPIFQAALGDNPEMIEFFVDKGVDPDEGWGPFSITPLVWTSQYCSPNAARMLIEKGADFSLSGGGSTTYDNAKYLGCESVMYVIEEKLEEMQKELKEIERIQKSREKQ